MFDLLSRSNVRLCLWLNHWLADHPALYKFGLFYQESITAILMAATLLLLWFWPQMTRATYLPPLAHPEDADAAEASTGKRDTRSLLFGFRARTVPVRPVLTRHDSRAQFLVLGIMALLGFLLAQIIAVNLNIPRPFISYWPVRSAVGNAFDGFRQYGFGSFPSETAVLLAGLPIALLRWDRRLAAIWAVLALCLGVLQVGLGFRYPFDVLVGALIGWLLVGGAFAIYERHGNFYAFFAALARAFDLSNTPYCIYLYIILIVLGVEFAMHMQHVLALIFQFSDATMYRFR